MTEDHFVLEEVLTSLEAPSGLVEQLLRYEIILPTVEGEVEVVTAVEVDRIRVACHLVGVMDVNIEGVDVALQLRERLLATQHQVDALLRLVQRLLREDQPR